MNITEKNSLLLVSLIGFLISSCSTYPNKFKCGDAKGLGCTMLRDVDMQIDSGKIEEVYKDTKKCTGNRCQETLSLQNLPW